VNEIGRGLPYRTNLATRWRNYGQLPITVAGACVEIRICVFPNMKQQLYNSTASFRLVPYKILDIMYENQTEHTFTRRAMKNPHQDYMRGIRHQAIAICFQC
jgi:hypothetical protein